MMVIKLEKYISNLPFIVSSMSTCSSTSWSSLSQPLSLMNFLSLLSVSLYFSCSSSSSINLSAEGRIVTERTVSYCFTYPTSNWFKISISFVAASFCLIIFSMLTLNFVFICFSGLASGPCCK